MITEKQIQRAIKAASAKWLMDDGDRGAGRLGFQVRLRQDGKLLTEWYAVSRRNGKRATAKVGAYPDMTLAAARAKFQTEYEPRIRAGDGPRKAAPVGVGTLGELVEGYVDDLRARGTKVAEAVERLLGRLLKKSECARRRATKESLGVKL